MGPVDRPLVGTTRAPLRAGLTDAVVVWAGDRLPVWVSSERGPVVGAQFAPR